MSSTLINMASQLVGRVPRSAEHVLTLNVDEALFAKIKRRERTMCVRPASKYWNDRLDGVQYTHIAITSNSGKKIRVVWKGAEKRRIYIAPDRRVTMWEIFL